MTGLMMSAILAALLQLPTIPARSIDQLAWLAGTWEATSLPGPHVSDWTVESWGEPRGGVMLGTSLSGRRHTGSFTMDVTNRARSFEFMRIAPGEGGALFFYASPNGAPAVAFRLTESSPAHAVFENPGNDYPQRITYRRSGRTLHASIAMLDGSRETRWTYWRRP